MKQLKDGTLKMTAAEVEAAHKAHLQERQDAELAEGNREVIECLRETENALLDEFHGDRLP